MPRDLEQYLTHQVKLWLDNDFGSYTYWQERAAEIRKDAKRNDEDPWQILADELEESHDDGKPEDLSGVYADLLTTALGYVDWRDIARDMLEDLEEEGDDEVSDV